LLTHREPSKVLVLQKNNSKVQTFVTIFYLHQKFVEANTRRITPKFSPSSQFSTYLGTSKICGGQHKKFAIIIQRKTVPKYTIFCEIFYKCKKCTSL
jgi:hypothetical protein